MSSAESRPFAKCIHGEFQLQLMENEHFLMRVTVAPVFNT